MAKILVVEDDADISGMISQGLGFEHYTVEVAADGEAGYALLKAREYDIAILDWELPKLSGIELCKKYRTQGGTIPVLLLTGKTEIGDRVKGLDSGADDYLTKPFSLDELTARIRSLLRRASNNMTSNSLIYKDLCLEPNNYLATKNGVELKLIPKEFAILELLLRYQGKVFSPEAIIDRIWENNEYPATDVIRTHIMNLRRKLGDSYIDTIHGIGYRLPPVK